MNPAVVISALLLAAVSLVSYSETQLSDSPRTDYELCQELREEVRLQMEVGLLSREEAAEITRRCFTLFVK